MRRALLACLLLAGSVPAQTPNSTLPSPRLTSLFPCGGQVGKSLDVYVRGSDLDEPKALRFSHPGIKGELDEFQPKAMGAPSVVLKAPDPTRKLFRVTIEANVPAGTHEVRFVGKWGVSNPRAFVVGNRPEINETEPNSDVPQAHKVERGTVINGVIDAQTDVDYYKFEGKKGERILLHCAASSIDSRARPLIEFFLNDGRSRIGFNSNDSGNDALCDVVLPNDGEYYVRISEFAYTGGSTDYYYRLSFVTDYWLDAIFPPMLYPNETAALQYVSRPFPIKDNINWTSTEVKLRGMDGFGILPQYCGMPDGFFPNQHVISNKPVYFASAPVIHETSFNDSLSKPQEVNVPCEIAGRIDVKNDRDCYKIAAKKNEPLMIELFAERIGTVMDGVLSIRDSKGETIVELDDDPEALHPSSFFNRTSDPPPYRFIPPADGDYTVMVSARDSNANFGPRTIYRLRIAPPKPDFRAVVMPRNRDNPSGVNVIPGSQTALDVFVERRDGFTGPVSVAIKGLPDGVTAKPTLIGTGQKWGIIILNGYKELKSAETDATVTATATIDGKEVSRPVRSASITWNVPNAPGSPCIARLDRGLVVAARPGDKAPFRLEAKLDKVMIRSADNKERPAGDKLAVKPGEKIVLPVSIVWQGEGARPSVVNLATEPTFAMQGAMAIGANNGQPIAVAKEQSESKVTLDVRPNLPPGLYHVMFRGDTRAQMTVDEIKKQKREFVTMAFAEPFVVKVLPASLGRLSANLNGVLKSGGSAMLTVKVERLLDFQGEFPLTINFPKDSGLSAEAAMIEAKSNEVKIKITASKDAKPGNVQNINIESAPTYDGDIVTHKIQTNINITK